MGTSFFRVSGAGNDFIVLVEPDDHPTSDRIRAWCRRGISLGADGLLVLRQTPSGGELRHFNADGRRSELCLNGSRCAARLLFELGWASDEATLSTDSGDLRVAQEKDGTIAVALPDLVEEPEPLDLVLGDARYSGFLLRVGVPHFVLPVMQGLAQVPVDELGPCLRAHPRLGDDGANVDFVRWTERSRFEIRTWERGVEGETLACGSGVVAAAAVGFFTGRIDLPVTCITAGGFHLAVSGTSLRALHLVGDARILARGEIQDEAERLPSPTIWS